MVVYHLVLELEGFKELMDERIDRQSVSCAIVVFNEEQNIYDCLDSAKWMDEIIIVDSYSTDQTIDICQQFTDHIFQRAWNGFGEQKNFAIHQAKSDWVFIIDADERITPELRREIETILRLKEANHPVAYSVPRRNYYYGKWVKHAGCYPDWQLRLFRNGIGQHNDGEPHPKFIFDGERGMLIEPLEHFTERTINDHFRKFRNLTTLAAWERGKSKKKVFLTDLIGRPLFTFFKYYLARKGFLDGMHGFLVSGFASMYTFVKYAKLYEKFR